MYFGLCELILCAPHSAVSSFLSSCGQSDGCDHKISTRQPTVDLVHLLFEELMTSKEKEEIFHSNSNLHCEMK